MREDFFESVLKKETPAEIGKAFFLSTICRDAQTASKESGSSR